MLGNAKVLKELLADGGLMPMGLRFTSKPLVRPNRAGGPGNRARHGALCGVGMLLSAFFIRFRKAQSFLCDLTSFASLLAFKLPSAAVISAESRNGY